MTQTRRYDVQVITAFVEQLFEKAGADAEVAQVVTQVLLGSPPKQRGVVEHHQRQRKVETGK